MGQLVVGDETYDWNGVLGLPNTDLIAIEDMFGWTADDLVALVERTSVKAVTAIVWLLRRRTDPTLMFEAVTFSLDTVSFVADEVIGDEGGPKDNPDPSEPPTSTGTSTGDDAEPASPEGSVATPSSDGSPTGATVHRLTSTG